jgi:hypothetical protein
LRSETEEQPSRASSAAILTKGWGRAALGAALVALALGVAAEGLAVLAYAAARGPKPGLVLVAKLGALNFLAFHHVAIVVDANSSLLGAGTPAQGIRLSLALMSGTAIAMWLLARVGRSVGSQSGGRDWERGLHGSKVALPYAAITVAVALLARVPLGSRGGGAAIRASIPTTIAWPLGLALVAGFVGGFMSERGPALSKARSNRTLHGALAGGAWMMGIGLALAFAGLVLMAPIKPEATRAYFAPFRQGSAEGVALIGYTLLAAPNLATWVLFPSMGACFGVSASAGGQRAVSCVLSYTRFPTQDPVSLLTGSGAASSHPPLGYYAFVLAPAIAVLVGGAIAGRRAGASSRKEATLAGALAGVVYALIALLVVVLADVAVAEGGPGGATFRLGVPVLTSTLIALGWGVLGGAAGGALKGVAGSRSGWTSTEAPPGTGDASSG